MMARCEANTKAGKQCKNNVKNGKMCHVHIQRDKRGSVYIMSNPSFDYVKIGRTSKDVRARAQELFTTGVPSMFVVEYSRFTVDAALAEARVFVALSGNRVSTKREFFNVSVSGAMDAVDKELSVLERGLSQMTVGPCRGIPSTEI